MMRTLPLVAFAVALALPAHAAVMCQKKSGTVVVRDACRKKEQAIDLSQFGAVGPKGDPGQPGAPGAPGTAAAYAHISSNGTLIVADSKNVTAASAAVGVGGTGAICITVDMPTVHVAAVTLDINESGGPSGRSIFVAIRPTAVAAYVDGGNCPDQTNVVVYTLVGTTPSTEELYVLFN